MSSSFNNSRRDFVKLASGAAASPFVALPSRHAFGQSRPNLRLLTCIDTYGISEDNRRDNFIRSTSGDYALRASDLGSTLRPLAPFIDNLIIPSNLTLDSRNAGRDAGTHHALSVHTLSGSSALGSSRREEANYAIRHSSVDIRIGEYLHNEYGLSAPRVHDHLFFTDYADRGSTTFCYNADGSQKRSIAGAQSVRDSLFSNIDASTGLQGRNVIGNSARLEAIALVQERLNNLSGSLENANEAEVLQAYRQSVDSVSRELSLASENVVTLPAEHDDDLGALLRTRYHNISHVTESIADDAQELVRRYQSEELAVLLERLSTTLDTDGSTLLDNTVVFFTSQMSNNVHRTRSFPHFIIAGKNTNLQGGFHYDCGNSTNNDLLTTLAQGLTLPIDNFGGHNRDGRFIDSLNNGPISRMLKS